MQNYHFQQNNAFQPQVFHKGIPLEPDLLKLDETFQPASFQPGHKLTYDEIAAALRIAPKSQRMKTVMQKWRKRIETTHGLIMGTLPGVGVIVLDGRGKMRLSQSKLKTAGKYAKRSLQVAAAVAPGELDEDERRKLMHNTHKAAAILGTLALKSAEAI